LTAPPLDERARWTASGEAWLRWADSLAGPAERLNAPLLAALGLGPRSRLLDLAAGAGEPALSAARLIGPEGLVAASDLVALPLRRLLGRPEGAAPLLPVAADMAALPFPDGAFTAASCRFGIMFVPDSVAALAELRRVMAPGARVAFLVWGALAGNSVLALVHSGVAAVLGEAAAAALDPLFRYAEPGILARELEKAGFVSASEQDVRLSGEADAGRPFWRAQLEMSFAPQLAAATAESRHALDAWLAAAVARTADKGRFRLDIHARLVTACRS